eukprot:scaffold4152_cov55-Phaeocystis_antarctica.AAC.3
MLQPCVPHATPYIACRCDQLCRAFQRQIGCNAIHGDKEQRERERVLQEFKDGRAPILVATDVAARGLDIKQIMMVAHCDPNPDPDPDH